MPSVHTHSEAGGHAENEDAFVVRPHPAGPGCVLAAVADGQGGRAGGARASGLACGRFVEAASSLSPDELLRAGIWSGILREVDQLVTADAEAGLTTVAALCVSSTRVAGGSCGDSAVALVTAGKNAILTERQFKDPPVGSGDAAFVSFAADLEPPWTILAMTDGVWKYAGWEEVFKAALADSPEGIAETLRRHAALPGGGLQDDFTLAVLRDRAD